jgi:hypothetical protein
MNSQQWPQVVSASVAPVVVISACGLLSLAFYNRLAAIIARVRGFQRERLHAQEEIHRLSRQNPSDVESLKWRRRFLDNLAEQTDRTIRRARLVRMTLLCLLGTIGLLVLSSLFNGLTVLWPRAQFGAAILYLSGMALLLVGICFAIAELLAALDVVESETALVTELAE